MTASNLAASLWQDLKFGVRLLRVNPGYAATAIVSLALGIAANTSIFSLVDQVLLRMLPVSNPRELVQFRMEGGRMGSQNGDGLHTFSYPLYLAFRDRNTVFSGLTGYLDNRVSMTSDDRSEMVALDLVAGNFFAVLGVRPHAGRVLAQEDDRLHSGNPVVVLQYDFWQSRFAGRQEAIGSTIRLNGSPFTVVGVAAPEFGGTNAGILTQMWAPVNTTGMLGAGADHDLDNERSSWFYVFARLKPGVTMTQAQAAISVLYDQRKQEEVRGEFFSKFPDTRERFLRQNINLIPADRGMSWLRRGFERPLVVLQYLVGVVLLIACTNVANLMLARAAARRREIAIRGALGAGRLQIVRQLLMESLILAAGGGVAGLLLSTWMTRGLVRLLPYDPATLALSVTPDTRLLLFTTAITLATSLLFGLVPACRGSNVPVSSTLKEEAGSVAGGHGHVRLRKTFVALQVALSSLLLIGAGLFVRTLNNLRKVDLGMQVENVVMFGVRPAIQFEESRKLQIFRTMIEGLAAIPGVKAVGANSARLFTGGRWDTQVTIPGVDSKDGNPPWSFFNAVTPGYFDALGIPIKAGRDLSWADWAGGKKVCLVNEALVREYLGGANPVGRLLGQGRAAPIDTEIIGVFGNARYHEVRGTVPRQTFLNFVRKGSSNNITVYARLRGDPRVFMPMLREQVRRVSADLVVFDMRTMDDQLNLRLANERILSFLSAGFALLATILAVVGLHGVLSFVVTRRTREIGIRMALGAGQRTVVRLVMEEMLAVILIGLAAGVAAAYFSASYVQTQLYGIEPLDPPVFIGGTAVLLAASLAASMVPAWRASRISPVRALRYE
jgi:predicted permease